MSREVELGCESWTFFASSCSSCSSTAVQRTLSLWLCPSTAVETAIARCTSRWAMARGHRLNTSIVLAAVHALSGLFRAVSAVEPSLFRPLPPLSPSLMSHLASVDVKQNGPMERHQDQLLCTFNCHWPVNILVSLFCQFLSDWSVNQSSCIRMSEVFGSEVYVCTHLWNFCV